MGGGHAVQVGDDERCDSNEFDEVAKAMGKRTANFKGLVNAVLRRAARLAAWEKPSR